MKKLLAWTVLVAISVAMLVGCAQTPPASTAPSQGAGAASSESAVSENTGTEAKFRIGLTTFGLANAYIRVGRDAAIAQAEQENVELLMSVDEDVSKRTAAIESFITQGADAIIVHEGDITQVLPPLQDAKASNILVCAMNSGFDEIADLVVEPDNTLLGRTAAEEMVKLMDGKGKIIEIYNDLGAMIKARKDAMHEVIADYPDIEIAGGFVYAWPDYYPDAVAQMEAILQANPEPGEIRAVFATFYGVGLAAAKAIREKGLENDIIVVGIDSDEETYQEMALPDSPYKVTVMSDAEQLGHLAIHNLCEILRGNEIPETHIFVDSEVITSDNIPTA